MPADETLKPGVPQDVQSGEKTAEEQAAQLSADTVGSAGTPFDELADVTSVISDVDSAAEDVDSAAEKVASDAEVPVWVPNGTDDSSTTTANVPFVAYEAPSGNPADLANSLSITCEFGAGRSGGVRSAPQGGAQWQGGPIVFDRVNLDAATAVMRGSVGATGSQTGQGDVRVDATANGLHFSGILAGNFVVTSVFDLSDESGGYVALMSRHNERPLGLHSSVFSGTCY